MCDAGENSYSHHVDNTIGVSVIDRFTYYSQRFFESVTLSSTSTLQDWYQALTFDRIHSNIATGCAALHRLTALGNALQHVHCKCVAVVLLSLRASLCSEL